MTMTAHGADRADRPGTGDSATSVSARHNRTSEHLANERTHLAYVRTAISLVTLGITMNRFSLYLMQHHELNASRRPPSLLLGTKQVGLGMVLFGFLLMLMALRRFHTVEQAIDRLDYRPQRLMIEGMTLSAVVAAALGIVWMFMR